MYCCKRGRKTCRWC